MTFQAYLDAVFEKTGLRPDDFKRLAAERDLLDAKASEVLAWLKADFELGSGHGMAIWSTFKPQPSASDRVDKQFAGAKAHWRPVFDHLLVTLREHGALDTAPTDTYISLLRGKSKFAVAAFTADRMDVGVKLKDAGATDRLEASGSWNAMVTHRVRVTDAAEVDSELLGWLRAAYDAAG
jgi:hypothetical protein